MSPDLAPDIVLGCFAAFLFIMILGATYADSIPQEPDWDRVVERYQGIKATVDYKVDADDRWRASIKVFGTINGKEHDIQTWPIKPRRDKLDTEMHARAKIDRIRKRIAAAESRKMRSSSATVPL